MYLCVCALAPGGLAPTVYKFLFMLGLGPPHLRRARLMRGQFEPQSNRHTAPPCCCIHHRTYPMHICNINLQPLTKTQSTNRPHIDKQCSPAFNSDGISWSTAGRRLAIVTRCIRNYFFFLQHVSAVHHPKPPSMCHKWETNAHIPLWRPIMRFACDIRIAATGITSNDKQFLKGENSYESSKSDGN